MDCFSNQRLSGRKESRPFEISLPACSSSEVGKLLLERSYAPRRYELLWKPIPHPRKAEGRSPQQTMVSSKSSFFQLRGVAPVLESSGISVSDSRRSREQLLQVWVSQSERALEQESEHCDISARRQWRKIVIEESFFACQPEFLKEGVLQSFEWVERGVRSVVESRRI